jgi:hypothetical protein
MEPPAEFRGILESIVEEQRNHRNQLMQSDAARAWNEAVAAGDPSVLPYSEEIRAREQLDFNGLHEVLKRWHAGRSTPSP